MARHMPGGGGHLLTSWGSWAPLQRSPSKLFSRPSLGKAWGPRTQGHVAGVVSVGRGRDSPDFCHHVSPARLQSPRTT